MFLFSMFAYLPKANALTNTLFIVGLTEDGTLYYATDSGSYGEVRNATSANNDHEDSIWIGQYKGGPTNFIVYRGFLLFDTSELTSEATVLSVTLKLQCGGKQCLDGDFNITIQSGMPNFPNKPLKYGDYLHTHYSGDYGQINTSSVTQNAYNGIKFNVNQTILNSLINKTGITKFCLRSSKDINYVAPTTYDFLHFDASDKYNPPILEIFYSYEEEETSSGGETGNGEPTSPIDIPEIRVPKIPIWGYYLILGSVCIVALTSLFAKPSRSKHGPNGVKIKRTQKRLPKRNKRGRFSK